LTGAAFCGITLETLEGYNQFSELSRKMMHGGSMLQQEDFKPKRLLKISQVAQLLSLSERWVWIRIAEGSLPVVRLKGATRIALTDVEDFVQVNRIPRSTTKHENPD
jgi:predicted DNA-binding transcriptional regulator AlpA